MAGITKPWTPLATELLAQGHRPAEVVRAMHQAGHKDVTANAVTKLRSRKGIARTNVDASGLILPEWNVQTRHMGAYRAQMLRHLTRRMNGQPLGQTPLTNASREKALDGFLRGIRDRDTVVDYDPMRGFVEVPRRYWYPIPNELREPIDIWIKDPNRNDDGTMKV